MSWKEILKYIQAKEWTIQSASLRLEASNQIQGLSFWWMFDQKLLNLLVIADTFKGADLIQ